MKIALLTLVIGLVVAVGGIQAQDSKRITRADAMAAVKTKVQPEYPPAARQLKIEGTVEVDVHIGETGAVEKVDILSGNPVLTRPAAEAVKRWKFEPISSGGKATKAVATLTFTFKL